MRYFYTFVFVLGSIFLSPAQSSVAKLKYEQAEEAYVANDLLTALVKLEEVEKMLGSINPKILYLRIMAQYKLLDKDKTLLKALKDNCSFYLKAYDGHPGLEEKYREVFIISENILQYEDNADFNEGYALCQLKKYDEVLPL